MQVRPEDIWDAVMTGNKAKIRLLIDNAAGDFDPNWRCSEGPVLEGPVLHGDWRGGTIFWAVCCNMWVDLAKKLLETFPTLDPNIPGPGGVTPLMEVCSRGDMDTLSVLIGNQRVLIDDRCSSDGACALMFAAYQNHDNIILRLITCGRYTPAFSAASNVLEVAKNNCRTNVVVWLVDIIEQHMKAFKEIMEVDS